MCLNNNTSTSQLNATGLCLQAREERDDPVVEYEKVTDTIKRRLESPVDSPEAERPELKKSKIPLALNSPVPIRREVKEGGSRSRGNSLERVKKATSPTSDSLHSGMSLDSIEPAISVPSTPGTPKKDSSTFNLLKDSDLFTQISKSKLEPAQPIVLIEKPKVDSCHVVAIKEHEIVKATVSSPEPGSAAAETAVEFVPQRAELVEVVEDADASETTGERRPSVDLGSEPKTFVVEVRTLEQRMRPTLGVLKRKVSDDANVPDLIPAVEKQNECQFTTRTPPSTPMDECEISPLEDAAAVHIGRDEVNEYLILEDVILTNDEDGERTPENSVASESASGKSIRNEEEVIYSEVEEPPQVNLQIEIMFVLFPKYLRFILKIICLCRQK